MGSIRAGSQVIDQCRNDRRGSELPERRQPNDEADAICIASSLAFITVLIVFSMDIKCRKLMSDGLLN